MPVAFLNWRDRWAVLEYPVRNAISPSVRFPKSAVLSRALFSGLCDIFSIVRPSFARKQPTDDIIAHVQMFLHTCRRVFAAFRLVSHVVDDGEFGSLDSCSVVVLYPHESQRVQTSSVYFGIFVGGQFLGVDHPLCPALRPLCEIPCPDSAPATASHAVPAHHVAYYYLNVCRHNQYFSDKHVKCFSNRRFVQMLAYELRV